MFLVFSKIFYSNYILIDFAIHPFNICDKYPDLWKFIKISYVISFNITILIISNLIYSSIFSREKLDKKEMSLINNIDNSELNLLVGNDENNDLIYIPEKDFIKMF